MKILIGTKNKSKIEGVKNAFQEFFSNIEIEDISVPSNVLEQPINDDIYLGALNRVNNLIEFSKKHKKNAEYFVGIESGITNKFGKWVNVSIAVIKDKNGYESLGMSPAYPIPSKYINQIKKTDLGTIMKDLFNKDNLSDKKGGVSYLTHNIVSREDLTKSAVIMALTKFINGDIWSD